MRIKQLEQELNERLSELTTEHQAKVTQMAHDNDSKMKLINSKMNQL